MIPGQVVNIIEVPIELMELPERCCSSSNIEGSLSNWQQMQTLDPATKYAMLDPPPASKIHARSLSDGTLKGRLENPPLSILVEGPSPPSTPGLQCPESPSSVYRKDSRNGISRDSSICSRDTSYSAAVPIKEDAIEHHRGLPYTSAQEPALSQLSEVDEASIPSAVDQQRIDSIQAGGANMLTTMDEPEMKTLNPMRKHSALSIGPISIQNIQFYNESRPGTMLNEDQEQYRPRVYSLPNSEVKSSEEGSPQVSPITTASRVPPNAQDQDDDFSPDSDVVEEVDLGSPSFSIATASSDGQQSPLQLSPQNSVKRDARSPTRTGGGAFTGFANRIRSLRSRQRPRINRREVEQQQPPPPRLNPPSFMNYILPHAVESNHSLAAKSHYSNISAQTRSAHEHMPAPTVFDDAELPHHASHFSHQEQENSMADAIFSELGYLSTSIG